MNNKIKQLETKSVWCTCSGKKMYIFFLRMYFVLWRELLASMQCTLYQQDVWQIHRKLSVWLYRRGKMWQRYNIPTKTLSLITVAALYIYMTLSLIKKIIEIFLTVFFPEFEKYAISSSDNLPVTVAILVCACVLIIIGVVITICVIR